jgi:hypothetical protein
LISDRRSYFSAVGDRRYNERKTERHSRRFRCAGQLALLEGAALSAP